ncbi:hypothetical protein Anas_06993 [Armadillidium nasatum]|uniref:Uncharacterized protein n=1 Tax=Armadillidium nasatum TaxID=96803 RepID=A0A5N5TBE6_9CRUS|nr:hypothetical protein Anas_06993 [Armadillidium nasatum]
MLVRIERCRLVRYLSLQTEEKKRMEKSLSCNEGLSCLQASGGLFDALSSTCPPLSASNPTPKIDSKGLGPPPAVRYNAMASSSPEN